LGSANKVGFRSISEYVITVKLLALFVPLGSSMEYSAIISEPKILYFPKDYQ